MLAAKNFERKSKYESFLDGIELVSDLNQYERGQVTYSRIGLLKCQGNLQSYWTTKVPRKLTVVLDYYRAKETYSRIGLLQSYETYSRIALKVSDMLVERAYERGSVICSQGEAGSEFYILLSGTATATMKGEGETTLETSGEDVKPHSKRVGKM